MSVNTKVVISINFDALQHLLKTKAVSVEQIQNLESGGKDRVKKLLLENLRLELSEASGPGGLSAPS